MSTLMKCWKRWREFTSESKSKEHTIRRAVLFWTDRCLIRTFDAWKDYRWKKRKQKEVNTRSIIISQRKTRKFWVRWTRKHKIFQRVLHRWKLLNVSAAFNRWKTFTSEQIELRNRMVAVALRWKNVEVARRFRTWLSFVSRRSNEKRIIQEYSMRRIQNTWKTFKNRFEGSLAHKQSLARAIRVWENRSLVAAWNTWMEFVEDSKNDRSLLRRAALMWTQSHLLKTLLSWVEYARRRKQDRSIGGQLSQNVMDGTRRRLFRRWVDGLINRQSLRKVIGVWMHRTLAKHMQSWKLLHWMIKAEHYAEEYV
jgi:hypothetical protein